MMLLETVFRIRHFFFTDPDPTKIQKRIRIRILVAYIKATFENFFLNFGFRKHKYVFDINKMQLLPTYASSKA